MASTYNLKPIKSCRLKRQTSLEDKRGLLLFNVFVLSLFNFRFRDLLRACRAIFSLASCTGSVTA